MLLPAIVAFGREIRNERSRMGKISLGIDTVGVICFLAMLGWVTVFFGSLIREKSLVRQVAQVLCVALVTEVLNRLVFKKLVLLF